MKEATIKPKGSDGLHLALFGATTRQGIALRECLDKRSFPVHSIHLFDRKEKEGSLTEFRKEPVLVTTPDPDLLGPVDLAFFCGDPEENRHYLKWPAERGFVAIDLSTASSGNPAVPIIHYQVNRSRLQLRKKVIASPGPFSQALSTILSPLHGSIGVDAVVATIYPPVSDHGEDGLNELYRQTVNLLNFQEVPKEIFRRQLAFNLIPRPLLDPSHEPEPSVEGRIREETLRILETDFSLEIASIQAPVFHCHSMLLSIQFRIEPSAEEIRDLLGHSVEFHMISEGTEKTSPAELAGVDALHVHHLGAPAERRKSHWMWIVSDNLRAGAVMNAVRLAEYLVGRDEP